MTTTRTSPGHWDITNAKGVKLGRMAKATNRPGYFAYPVRNLGASYGSWFRTQAKAIEYVIG